MAVIAIVRSAGWFVVAGSLGAQPLSLSLTDALRLAQGKSEQVSIARAGVKRAYGEQVRARAQRMPQLNSALSYTRTLATEFSGLFDSAAGTECPPLSLNPGAPVTERLAELERVLQCGGGFSFGGSGAQSSLPFGRKNIWQLGLSFAQPIYAGGRIGAQNRLAEALREAADLQVGSADAQFMLDVTQAFYDTALAQGLLNIAESSLADATRTLEFVRLAHEVGRLPEFDVLRARVSRRNQLPEIARRRAAVQQSSLRLKQLLDLPPDTDLELRTDLSSTTLPPPAPFEERYKEALPGLQVDERTPVLQANAAVRQSEANLKIARSQRLPSVSIASDYGLVSYPQSFLPTSTNQFRNNWTLGAAATMPIFQGGRIRADIIVAEANLEEARAQRQLTRELALLDTSVSLNQLRTAEEQWKAAAGTIEEAARAFEIATLRYREGISNQLEVDDARSSLRQARINRAQAARDLQVARVTVALLPLLPLNTNVPTQGQPQAPSRTQIPAGLQQSATPANTMRSPAAATPTQIVLPRSAAGAGARSVP